MNRVAWIVVALVSCARVIAAFAVPLTGDEAYYWEWGRRLAFGYTDHPPAVAWTIAAFSWLGDRAGFVRFGFIVCGALSALAIAGCATTLAGGDRRAGSAAAIIFTLAPLASLAFTAATPDGPYLLFWCLALYAAAKAYAWHSPLWWPVLGLALGGALLSRMFALALVSGVVMYGVLPAQRDRMRGLWVALAIAALTYIPFVAWNAAHGWATFAFSFVHRHEESSTGLSFGRFASLLVAHALAYSPGIFVAVALVAARSGSGLVALTALPLLVVLFAIAFVAPVEVYWTLGPFASLCAGAGLAYARLDVAVRPRWRAGVLAPAAVLLVVLFAGAFAPGPVYGSLTRATSLHLRNSGPFEVYTYKPLARDVASIASSRDAVVMTDGYGFSSVLDFDARVAPVVIGYDWQGRESRRWYPSTMHPARALFVDKEPLISRPDVAGRLFKACHHVQDGGVRRYRFGAVPPRAYYLTWCDGLAPNGIAILRWDSV